MTSNPYVIARLTANGPDYRGELHATPYNGAKEVEPLTDEAMRMLELDFLAAEHVSNSLRRMGDRTLWAKVIRYGPRSPRSTRSRCSGKSCSVAVIW